MQRKMQAFWDVLGDSYCFNYDYKYITKNDNIAERDQIHDDTLCIINLDGSGSMNPGGYENNVGDYYEAVKGAKVAVAYLKKCHASPEKCKIQLWENDPWGVILDYEGMLTEEIPIKHWKPSFHTKERHETYGKMSKH